MVTAFTGGLIWRSAWGWLARWGLSALWVLLASGCASLPTEVHRVPSAAIADYAQTPLSAMADRVLPPDGRSGFRLLPEASAAFATRIELTRLATQSLDLQYYLFQADDTGRSLLRALRDAAARGVRVRLLVDDFYTAGEDALLGGLAAYPNVEVRLFNPFPAGRSSTLTRFLSSAHEFGRVNRRMHNKLFVADNAAAVVGGRNIADEYFMRASSSNFVDIDAFAAGPVVRDLSAAFDSYWNSGHAYPVASIAPSVLTREAAQRQFDQLVADASTPAVAEVPPEYAFMVSLPGELAAQQLKFLVPGRARVLVDPLNKTDGANERSIEGTVLGGVLEWFKTAREQVVMVSPYLVPGPGGMAAMAEARKAGLHLLIYTNALAASDEPLVHVGYSRYRQAMLKLGVEVHEASPSLTAKRRRMGLFGASKGALHAKLAILDRKQIFLGSMNLDQRSAVLNTELGVIIDSPELAAQMLERFDRASSYTLRLAADGETIEWLEEEDGRETVYREEPEASLWLRIKLFLLGPFVPEKQL